MDLNTLKNINLNDLKNINPKVVQEFIKGKLETIIILSLIVATFCATISIYNNARGRIASQKAEISKSEQKLKIADELKKIEKEFGEFKEKFPKPIPGNQFNIKLSEFAIKNNVQTVSFSSPQKSGDEALELTTISFDVSAEDYPSLMKYIQDIESSPYALRLHKFNATLQQLPSGGMFGGQMPRKISNTITVNLEIGLLELKI